MEVMDPREDLSSADKEERSMLAASNRNANAMRIPPAATNGVIHLTANMIPGRKRSFRTCLRLRLVSSGFKLISVGISKDMASGLV